MVARAVITVTLISLHFRSKTIKTKKHLILSSTLMLTVIILAGLFFHIVRTTFQESPEDAGQDETLAKTEGFAYGDLGQSEMPKADQLRIPNRAERRRMSKNDRIALLEKLGCVPDDPEMSDYFLAEHTSWWGKRLDPKKFWKDRVLWYDDSAEFEARRRGRGYPPMPYEDSSITNRSDVDKKADGFHIEGSQPNYVSSERESVFWSKFKRTHPRPPNSIQRWLSSKSDSWLYIKHKIENDPDYVRRSGTTPKYLERSLGNTVRDANSSMLPPESATPEAYLWDYVMRKRIEYEKLVSSGSSEESLSMKLFFNQVYVDHILITNPLTQEQVDAANAWKVAYLNRLRSENWDESYINAYLQAWNLTEEYVFGETKGQGR